MLESTHRCRCQHVGVGVNMLVLVQSVGICGVNILVLVGSIYRCRWCTIVFVDGFGGVSTLLVLMLAT